MKTLGLVTLLIMTLVLTACGDTGFTSVDRAISRFFGYKSSQECRVRESNLDRKGDWKEYCRKTCPLLKSQIDWRPYQFSMTKVKTFIQKYERVKENSITEGFERENLIREIKNELDKFGKYFGPQTYCTSMWKKFGHFIRGSEPPETLPPRT